MKPELQAWHGDIYTLRLSCIVWSSFMPQVISNNLLNYKIQTEAAGLNSASFIQTFALRLVFYPYSIYSPKFAV